MSNHKEDLTEAFNDWFNYMLHKTRTCFDRDVLRDCRAILKEHYVARAKAWPDDPAPHEDNCPAPETQTTRPGDNGYGVVTEHDLD